MLEAILDSLDGIEEPYQALYSEKNGKFEITGIKGVKTQADVDRLQSALVKERSDHKLIRDRFSLLADKDPAEVLSQLDRLAELETIHAGKNSDKTELIEKRLKVLMAPIERDKDGLQKKVSELTALLDDYSSKEKKRLITDEVMKAALKSKVRQEALEDAVLLAERVFEINELGQVVTKDGCGYSTSIDASVWLMEIQTKRPHWWEPSVSGGATGNRGTGGMSNNPWRADSFNMTEQGKILNANPALAEQMARSAGTVIGGGPKKIA